MSNEDWLLWAGIALAILAAGGLLVQIVAYANQAAAVRGASAGVLELSPAVARAIEAHRLLVGMSEEMVRESWGFLYRSDSVFEDGIVRETWTYSNPFRVAYFENGILTGWRKLPS